MLELFRNTLPSRLYYMLYQINDLRVTVETAKRLLMKEQIDKQKSGQSSVSPFMKASKVNTKTNSEKGVSFEALETIDRHSYSIERLASMVSKLDMRLEKKEVPYRPKYIKVEIEDADRGRVAINPGIVPTVGTMFSTTTEEEEVTIMITEIIGPTTEIEIGQEMGMETEN